jgi:hypothetical protein
MGSFTEAKQLWDETEAVQAELTGWGIHLNNQGSGDNGFNWLKDEKDLIRLVRLLPYIFIMDEAAEQEDLAFVNQLMDRVEQRQVSWSDARVKFNEHFGQDWDVLWWGPFADLLTSELEGPAWARGLFWDERSVADGKEIEEEDEGSPIPPDMKEQFAEWLAGWVS